jgi:bisphosphoglycerate-independent phosphoglycerate mutase (AlkP superfamily)
MHAAWSAVRVMQAERSVGCRATENGMQADWSIVERGWQAHVLGEAPDTFTDAVDAVKAQRGKSGDPEKPVSDQFLDPFVIVDSAGKAVGPVEDGDAVVIFNFRADRVVQLAKALEYDDFSAFDRCALPPLYAPLERSCLCCRAAATAAACMLWLASCAPCCGRIAHAPWLCDACTLYACSPWLRSHVADTHLPATSQRVHCRKRRPDIKFVGMMQYDGDLKLPANFLVPPPQINNVSGQFLVASGVRTFACSETQKFGHVTFFWNGNRSGYFSDKLETYLEVRSAVHALHALASAGACMSRARMQIESDKVVFNEKPEMKAREITDAGIEALKSGKFDMVRVNYANPDMVGHTGDLAATTSVRP